jgi:membrane-associated protease RseP (regulator of RpoE activity)
LTVDKNQTDKGLKRYYWLAFVIGGMVIGLLGCLAYSHISKADRGLLSNAAGNPKTDKPIVQAALTVQQPPAASVFLGVEIMSVDSIIAQQFGLENPCGVIVNSVVDGSPAQEAGLQRSDVILSLNGIAVEDVEGFRNIMSNLKAGDSVKIFYIRNRQRDATYAVLVASSSAVIAQQPDGSGWGVSLSVLGSDLHSLLRIPANIKGIVILSVTPDGLADEAGLQAGDVVTAVNNTSIADMSDFLKALSSDKDGIVLLDVYSRGNLRYVALDSSGVIESVAQTQPSLLDRILSVFTDDNKVILVEHINEEDDYEKPVCKRLEESGERY